MNAKEIAIVTICASAILGMISYAISSSQKGMQDQLENPEEYYFMSEANPILSLPDGVVSAVVIQPREVGLKYLTCSEMEDGSIVLNLVEGNIILSNENKSLVPEFCRKAMGT